MATTFRFSQGANQDNTFRTKKQDAQSKAYAATIALVCDADLTKVLVAQLTGALTLSIGVGSSSTAPYVGDEVELIFSADGTNRVVTFGTGFASAGTLTVTASKKATACFMFDGAAWVEKSRAVTA